jgi:hypothetical protein
VAQAKPYWALPFAPKLKNKRLLSALMTPDVISGKGKLKNGRKGSTGIPFRYLQLKLWPNLNTIFKIKKDIFSFLHIRI